MGTKKLCSCGFPQSEPEHEHNRSDVLFKKWVVQADPENKGKHPLHDHRFITTDDYDFDDPHGFGVIICAMRDLKDQETIAKHIIAAHNIWLDGNR
jgi:hypothetical protein